MFDNDSIEILIEIRDYLSSINDRIDGIRDKCIEMNLRLSDISGTGAVGITELYDKLTDIESSIDNLNI